jgi:DNA-directed RNA polymerase specialized sigma24 family protein
VAAERLHALDPARRDGDHAAAVADRLTLAGAVAGLPGAQRDVIAALYLADKDTAAAACDLGVEHETVRSRRRRALGALRAAVAAPA